MAALPRGHEASGIAFEYYIFFTPQKTLVCEEMLKVCMLGGARRGVALSALHRRAAVPGADGAGPAAGITCG